MSDLNKWMGICRLGSDPEKKITPNGASVINISAATGKSYKNKSGEKVESTNWHRLVIWNKLADIIEQYCKKGSRLYIEGELETRNWETESGEKRYTTEIIVRQMQMLDSKQDSQQSPKNQEPLPTNNTSSDDFVEDDIPF